MDVSIVMDEATGLPALPEGYFWRVGYSELSIMRNAAAGNWSDWVSKNAWRYSDYEREGRTIQVGVKRFTRRPVMVEQSRYRRPARVVAEFVKRYGEWDEDWRYSCCIEPDPMTRENLYDRACEVYNNWQQKLAERALVGDYPPKKFAS